MSGLFGHLLPNGGGALVRNSSGEVGLSTDVTNRNLSFKQRIGQLSRFPNQVSAQQVEQMAGVAANMQAQAELVTRWSRHAIAVANANAQMHETASSHASAMMNVNNRLQRTDVRYNQNLLKYGSNSREATAQLNGYQSAYQGAMQSMSW